MYQIIIKKKDLDASLAPLVDAEATVLPAWDPMGALAVVHGEE
jgi:aminopeptidase C